MEADFSTEGAPYFKAETVQKVLEHHWDDDKKTKSTPLPPPPPPTNHARTRPCLRFSAAMGGDSDRLFR